MAHESVLASWSAGESFVGRLAQFFPEATPVRLPVQVSGTDPHGRDFAEHTVIEYGTPSEVLFACTLPLEFDDRVRLQTADGSLLAEAAVVAVQVYEGRMAVAVRFLHEVPNWIIKR